MLATERGGSWRAAVADDVPAESRARILSYREWAAAPSRGRHGAIINADDWGEDRLTTEKILGCVTAGSVASVSAMVFMPHSREAARMARACGLDVGLHLNLTTPFSATGLPAGLIAHQQRVASYLRRSRANRYLYNPSLARSFEYVVAAQFDEFETLYQAAPSRVDGHHHMHLCANVIVAGLLPRGLVVRRNQSFARAEKSVVNRTFRCAYDCVLATRYRMVDALVNLWPLRPPARLTDIFSRARGCAIEVEAHPARPEEFDFLTNGSLFQLAARRAPANP